MKTTFTLTISLLLSAIMMFATTIVWGQQSTQDFITIKGVVKDKKSNKTLEYANISIANTNIGTITNSNGEFSIKVKDINKNNTLNVTNIGYINTSVQIDANTTDLTIFLTPHPNLLSEITVLATEAYNIVRRAVEKVEDNYSNNNTYLTGFYRETIKKRRNYINVSEAIVEIHKTPYNIDASRDAIQIYKGRRVISPNPNDTLMVKLLGGPNLAVFLDIVKNPNLILDKNTLAHYSYSLLEPVNIDDRLHYVVKFTPQVVMPYALHIGKLYIDRENYTISRAEFSLDMNDRNKATQAILRKKPSSMRFRPEEISFLVNYKERDGKMQLNYVRSEIRFKCDWRRRLFSTNYTVVSETVITNSRTLAANERIPVRDRFNPKHSLSDKVQNFYDKDFWEDYNIIEPEESLELAVNRLKKENSK